METVKKEITQESKLSENKTSKPYVPKRKRVRMKRQPIEVEIKKELFIKKSAPIPMTVKGFTPQLTRFSGMFNDFNKEWRDKRERPQKNKHQKLSHYGSLAAGFYRHDKEPKAMVKFKQMKSEKVMELDPVEIEKE